MSPDIIKNTSKKPLQRMFTIVPPRYDLINHLITLGLDNRWRRKAAIECLTSHPGRVLDLGCGTGDLIIAIARVSANDAEFTGIDYSQPMLEIAARKTELLARGRNISFIYGDAASLPFPDGYFDCVGISFAFRNLTYKNPLAQLHLSEVRRVLSTGGRYVIVETSQPKSKLIRKIFHLYLCAGLSSDWDTGSLTTGRHIIIWLSQRLGFILQKRLRQCCSRLAFAGSLFTPSSSEPRGFMWLSSDSDLNLILYVILSQTIQGSKKLPHHYAYRVHSFPCDLNFILSLN